jgi:16S rRNA (guanine966-N2)-methyltransferase
MRPPSPPRRVSTRHASQASDQTGSAKPGRTEAQAVAERLASKAAQVVRIMGGRWKRTPLPVPVAAGLRPTPSRVRETLFNWLGQDLAGWRVLDAFAGTGALGWEAASRGAESVTLLERDAKLVHSLKGVQARLKAEQQVHVQQADALSWMRHPAQNARFDLVFIDPPFDDDAFVVALTAAAQAVAPGGWVYLEAPRAFGQPPAEPNKAPPDAVTVPPSLTLHRHGQAGAVHFHLFQRVAD